MFGPRLSRIFASRWAALWWAATILLLAWQLVPAPDDDDNGGAGANHDLASAPSNPWSIDAAHGAKEKN